MSSEELKMVALSNGGFETPELNHQLFLNFRGYQRIQNLDAYTGLKSLWLDSNGLHNIENLCHLDELRCLFLQKNMLQKIANLPHNLVQIDLSENRISCIDGLKNLPNLVTLNVAKNVLADGESISHLQECTSLTTIDLSQNLLKGDNVVSVLANIAGLVALNMTGNPVLAEMTNFRKKCIVAMKNLRYLDSPVFDVDRAAAEAWGNGGIEAEIQTKKEWRQKQRAREHQGMEDFREWQAQVRAEKEEEIRQMARCRPTAEQQTTIGLNEKLRKDRESAAALEAETEKRIYAMHDNHLVQQADNDSTCNNCASSRGHQWAQNIHIRPKCKIDEGSNRTKEADDVDDTSDEQPPILIDDTFPGPKRLLANDAQCDGKAEATVALTSTYPKSHVEEHANSVNNGDALKSPNSSQINDGLDNKTIQLVAESLNIYRQQKKTNDTQVECCKGKNAGAEATDFDQGEGVALTGFRGHLQATMDAVENPTTHKALNATNKDSSIIWTECLDLFLAKQVYQGKLDFSLVALDIQKRFPGLQITADTCKSRWIELGGDLRQQNPPDVRPGLINRGSGGRRQSLKEIHAQPSKLLLLPLDFPKVINEDDGDDASEEGSNQAFLSRKHIWDSISAETDFESLD